jgi:hypothetical protein
MAKERPAIELRAEQILMQLRQFGELMYEEHADFKPRDVPGHERRYAFRMIADAIMALADQYEAEELNTQVFLLPAMEGA